MDCTCSRSFSELRLLAYRSFTIFVACFSPYASAQSGQTVGGKPRLIAINVTALDSKGKPVTDLKKEDFVLQESGKDQDIAVFRFEGRAVQIGSPAAPPVASEDTSQVISAVLLDWFAIPPQSSVWARGQLMRFLQAAPPENRIGLYRIGLSDSHTGPVLEGGVTVVYDYSRDAEPLRAAVAQVSKTMPLNKGASVTELATAADQVLAMAGLADASEAKGMRGDRPSEFDRVANLDRLLKSLTAIEALGNHLGQVPGRKNLVWITTGFDTTAWGPAVNHDSNMRLVAQRIAQNGVTLYIMDPTALDTGRDASTTRASGNPIPYVLGSTVDGSTAGAGMPTPDAVGAIRRQYSTGPWATMQAMADITGGRHLSYSNDMAQQFIELGNDGKGAYTLGFYATRVPSGEWHPLKLKSKRSGVKLNYRQGYIAE